MKLYDRFSYLAYWFRYQATYLEMKYHLKQVLNGKEEYYIKPIHHYDRNIGKSAALARLSVKYDIPIAVPIHSWKSVLERDIPRYLPKYFKKKRPVTIVMNENMRDRKYKILLMEECLSDEQIGVVNYMTKGTVVGYRNMTNFHH